MELVDVADALLQDLALEQEGTFFYSPSFFQRFFLPNLPLECSVIRGVLPKGRVPHLIRVGEKKMSEP